MKATFAAKTFAAKTFASGAWVGVGVEVTATTPDGLDFAASDNRPHFSAINSRPHFAATDNRPHFYVEQQ